MNKGQSVIGTVIMFVLYLLVFAGFLTLINWESAQKNEITKARFTATTSEHFLNNLLKRPTNVQLSGNSEVDTIADLVVYSYEDSEARETLKHEIKMEMREIHPEYERSKLPYGIRIKYPAGESLTIGDLEQPSPTLMGTIQKTMRDLITGKDHRFTGRIYLPVPNEKKPIQMDIKGWKQDEN